MNLDEPHKLKDLSAVQSCKLGARRREVYATIMAGDFDPLVEYHLKCSLSTQDWLRYLQVLQARQAPHCETCGQAIHK